MVKVQGHVLAVGVLDKDELPLHVQDGALFYPQNLDLLLTTYIRGDTYQQTTKGVAIYLRADNAPAFVSGLTRWTLTAEGLVQRPTARGQE